MGERRKPKLPHLAKLSGLPPSRLYNCQSDVYAAITDHRLVTGVIKHLHRSDNDAATRIYVTITLFHQIRIYILYRLPWSALAMLTIKSSKNTI